MASVSGVRVATNFDRITESPEKLAWFISEHFGYCGDCPAYVTCHKLEDDEAVCMDAMFQWLQEECE